tara:strand:- start:2568 stop:2906 length:339 start_codon:yes stop_codon:yes gene_type:complete
MKILKCIPSDDYLIERTCNGLTSSRDILNNIKQVNVMLTNRLSSTHFNRGRCYVPAVIRVACLMYNIDISANKIAKSSGFSTNAIRAEMNKILDTLGIQKSDIINKTVGELK